MLPRLDSGTEVPELPLDIHIRTKEMIDTDGDANTLGTIKIAQIAIVHKIRTLCGLDIDKLDILVARHLIPIDTTLIVRHVDALLLIYGVTDERTKFQDWRQRTIRRRNWHEGIGFRSRKKLLYLLTLPVVGIS